MWRPRRPLLLLALLALPLHAHAVFTCSGANTAMSLGNYIGNQATVLDSSTVFIVTCRRFGGGPTQPITVGLGASTVSGSIANRQMRLAAGTDLLAYNIYRDTTRLQVWGNTIGTNTVAQNLTIPNGATRTATFTFYGRINALQDVRAGTYNDTLTVTVTF
jgi:spore coat protein U-like protein